MTDVVLLLLGCILYMATHSGLSGINTDDLSTMFKWVSYLQSPNKI